MFLLTLGAKDELLFSVRVLLKSTSAVLKSNKESLSSPRLSHEEAAQADISLGIFVCMSKQAFFKEPF